MPSVLTTPNPALRTATLLAVAVEDSVVAAVAEEETLADAVALEDVDVAEVTLEDAVVAAATSVAVAVEAPRPTVVDSATFLEGRRPSRSVNDILSPGSEF